MKTPKLKLKPEYMACRDIGHAWRYAEWNGNRRRLVCECGTARVDVFRGYLKDRVAYRYPPQYTIHGITPSQRQLILRTIRRALQHDAKRLNIRWADTGEKRA